MPDWDAQGLTGGLDDKARAARIALLDELARRGVPVEELRRAVAEERLVLLLVEHVLGGQPRYARADVAARAGIDEELVTAVQAALGLPVPPPNAVAYTRDDVRLAKRLRRLLAAGVPPDLLLEIARVLGLGMARYADAVRTAFGRGFVRPGDSEHELATRYAALAERLLPENAAMLQHAFVRHLLELMRSDVITAAERERGEVVGRTVLAVGFADLVGFTWLGEHVESEELGAVGARLAALANQAMVPPCRLVKTIGDAVMLVSFDVEALVRTLLQLVYLADDDEQVPALRAGVALGPAVARFGDYYGSAVNLASRVTGKARPGTVLATEAVRDALSDGEGLRWSRAGWFRLKGFDGVRALWRVRGY